MATTTQQQDDVRDMVHSLRSVLRGLQSNVNEVESLIKFVVAQSAEHPELPPAAFENGVRRSMLSVLNTSNIVGYIESALSQSNKA